MGRTTGVVGELKKRLRHSDLDAWLQMAPPPVTFRTLPIR